MGWKMVYNSLDKKRENREKMLLTFAKNSTGSKPPPSFRAVYHNKNHVITNTVSLVSCFIRSQFPRSVMSFFHLSRNCKSCSFCLYLHKCPLDRCFMDFFRVSCFSTCIFNVSLNIMLLCLKMLHLLHSRARAASSKGTVSSVPAWFRADAGTNLIKQGEIVTGRPCGSVAQWSECSHGMREVLGSSSGRTMCFFLPCDIWWLSVGPCSGSSVVRVFATYA